MASDTARPKTHMLHFFYDDEDNCALTVLVNDVRFHIIVDVDDLKKSREKPLYYEYLDKLYSLRDAEQREAEESSKQNKPTKERRSNDKDSAVDMTGDSDSDADQDSGSASVELRNWILGAFADVTAEWAPPNREPEESSLYDWYHGPTYFYSLQIKAGQLEPELLETTDELNARIEELVPRLNMPKYIQGYKLPWIDASDLTVQSEVSLPEPAHPGQVANKDGEVYFFKPVVADQPGPVKRELQILQQLAKLDLDIKAPKLLGFVSYGKSKTDTMGFLLSNIDTPKPLTKLLKASVAADKRAEWSKKSKAIIDTLHKNNIIWGDAKADNFVIDKHDELWIIDFGGSYTEGWVDPELSETIEGDEQGLGKIQAALKDPEENTFDPAAHTLCDVQETASSLFVTERKEGAGEKRKRGDEGDAGGKKKRRESAGGEDEAEYVDL